jgi:hypothetical protein
MATATGLILNVCFLFKCTHVRVINEIYIIRPLCSQIFPKPPKFPIISTKKNIAWESDLSYRMGTGEEGIFPPGPK